MHHRFVTFFFQRFNKAQGGDWVYERGSRLFCRSVFFVDQAHRCRHLDKLLIALAGYERDEFSFQVFGIGTCSHNPTSALIANRQGLVKTRADGIQKLLRDRCHHLLLLIVQHQLAL